MSNKRRLFEVMQKTNPSFKPKLNENVGGNIDDPTKEEMVNFLTKKFHGLVDPMETDGNEFDVESAIYWFANDYHGGQNSNLYSALSTSQYRPSLMHKSIEDDESETATMMYQELVDAYGGTQDQEVDNSQWMGMSMNEKDVSVQEEIQYPSSDEYKSKVEKIKQTMDTLFNDEYYDVIDTLFKLLVSREKGSGQIASLSEDLTGRFNIQHTLTNDDTRDISINIVDKLVADGIVPDDMNTDNENEFRTQDIIHEILNQVFKIQNQ